MFNRLTIQLLLLSTLTLCATSCTPPATGPGKDLAGLYRLYSVELQDSAGDWRTSDWGKGGESYIIYDGRGHMAVEITPKGYKDFPWLKEEQAINDSVLHKKIDSMSVPELKAAVAEFASNYVYFANYNIDDSGKMIIHQRISSTIPAIWGTEAQRRFGFFGDTLILKNPKANRILKWIREK